VWKKRRSQQSSQGLGRRLGQILAIQKSQIAEALKINATLTSLK
jgi:hypothetical protein